MDEMTCGYCERPFEAGERTLWDESWVHGYCALEIMSIVMPGGSVELVPNATGEVPA